jgi:hypothetical protein
MYDRRNDYLRRRRDRKMHNRGGDGRNSYGSEYDRRNSGGYGGDRRNSDFHYGSQRHGERMRPMEYEVGIKPMDRGHSYMNEYYGRDQRRDYNDYNRDYNDYNDYGRDYGDYNDYASMDKEYEEDLKKWAQKLKKHDRFGLKEEEVFQKAKDMKVKFEDFSEDEFYTTYLMMISDYPSIANEPHTYLAMAKNFLEDKDIAVSPSEKLCIYMYEIVMGEGK